MPFGFVNEDGVISLCTNFWGLVMFVLLVLIAAVAIWAMFNRKKATKKVQLFFKLIIITGVLCAAAAAQNDEGWASSGPELVPVDALIEVAHNIPVVFGDCGEGSLRDMFALFLYDDSLNYTPPLNNSTIRLPIIKIAIAAAMAS